MELTPTPSWFRARREFLRDNHRRRQPRRLFRQRLRHSIQGHAWWCAHYALQILQSTELHRRRCSLRRASTGHRRKLLRCHMAGGSLQPWHNLQNDTGRRSERNLQLLLAECLHRRRKFYGTTYNGGANNVGTVFKISSAGKLKTLHSFCSQSGCADGYGPRAGLELGSDGDFYGTTYYGGSPLNDGTVFKITPAGKLTTLHSFDGADGANPIGSLGQDTNGSFYGTTGFGGTSSACTGGCGTVFRVSVGLGPFVEIVPT